MPKPLLFMVLGAHGNENHLSSKNQTRLSDTKATNWLITKSIYSSYLLTGGFPQKVPFR